jgi:integrase
MAESQSHRSAPEPGQHRRHGEGTAYYDAKRGLHVVERVIEGKTYRATSTVSELVASRRLQAKIGGGDPTSPAYRGSLRQYILELWLPVILVAENRRDRTVEGYRRIMARHVLPELGDVQLTQLRRRQVSELMARLATKGTLSGGTRRNVLRALSSAMSDAVDQELIDANPLAGMHAPSARTRRVEVSSTLLTQLETAMDQAGPLRSLYFTLYYTGMRFGEAAGLRWERVDWRRAELAIDPERGAATLIYNADRTRLVQGFGAPKTSRGTRKLAIGTRLMPILRREWEARGRPARGLLFHSMRSPERPISERVALDDWKRLCREHGIETSPPLTLHDLRHVLVTTLLQAGVDDGVVAEIVGHANAGYMRRMYQGLVSGAARDAIELVRPQSLPVPHIEVSDEREAEAEPALARRFPPPVGGSRFPTPAQNRAD